DVEIPTEVGLYQHPDGPPAVGWAGQTGRGPDTTLPAERDSAGAGPHASFRHGAAGGSLDGSDHILRRDGPLPDRVQHVAVIGLTDYRVDRAHVPHPGLCEQV